MNRTVIGWHGDPLDDATETSGWAWLRLNEIIWRRHARRFVRWAAAWWDRTRDG